MSIFRNNWSRALIINIVILILVLLFTDMLYETNDDYAIAGRIFSGDPYVYYIGYHVCLILIKLQQLIPALNAVVLLGMFLAFVSFTVITWIILELKQTVLMRIILVMSVALYSFDQYSVVQFTKASAVMLTAGTLLLTDCIIKRRAVPLYILGAVLFYFGVAFRFKNIAVAVGFAGLFILFWIIERRKDLRKEGYLNAKAICSYAAILILIAGAVGVNSWSDSMNRSTEGLVEYHKYNDERSTVIDYSQFDRYDEKKREFDLAGLSKNDLYLIDNWYLDYDGAASVENLKTINGIYDESRPGTAEKAPKAVKKCLKHVISKMRSPSATGSHIFLLIGLALLALVTLKPGRWLYVIALGGATLCLYIALFYMGRPAYRVMYIVDIEATFWLLYYFDGSRFIFPPGEKAKGAGKALKALSYVVSVAVILILAGGIYVGQDRCVEKYKDISGGVRSEALANKIREDQEHVYVFSTREKKNPETYANPIRSPEPDANVFTFGGWGTKSPYLLKKMENYGLENLFEDLINNENAYVIENRNVDRMEEYFNKWYAKPGQRISYMPVDDIDGKKIWRIVRED